MANYFETTCQYELLQESGKPKKVTEHLLFEAETFSDAEYQLTARMHDCSIDEYYVKDIKRKKIDAVYDDEGASRWYDVRVTFITVDERGNEKKSSGDYFVQADSSDSAALSIRTNFKGCLQDWEIHTIRESQISDVFIQD